MATFRVELPPKLIPVFTGEAMYRGSFGGRGSAKTRSFAKMTAVFGLSFAQQNQPGIILCAREYMNSLADSSFAEVKSAIESEPWLLERYEIGQTYIRTKCRKIEYAFAGLRHNLASVKGKGRIRIVWVDEAEQVSELAWSTLIPTVRDDGSEIWLTWNPERKQSATHKRFRENPPEGAKIVQLNYTDNPWFPTILERTRLEDLEKRPDQYAHIWEGDFVTVVEGAYFARDIVKARKDGRFGFVPVDPLMTIRAYWDIGGTGAKADSCAIVVCQFVGKEIRVLDHYEAQGQPLAAHVRWLIDRGWSNALCILPHDGVTHDRVFDATYESELKRAGFEARTVPNQGKGAASLRIEAVRKRWPQIWINEKQCVALIEALSWYHEKIDVHRQVGLGPCHDWSSHSADAFGLMAIDYKEPSSKPATPFKFTFAS